MVSIDMVLSNLVSNTATITPQVSIQDKTTGLHKCGGSLITLSHVLTAAHCIVVGINDFGSPIIIDKRRRRIIAGDTTVGKYGSQYRQYRYPSEFIWHPEYDCIRIANDIAIIRLNRRFVGSGYVKVMPLSESTPSTNHPCVIVGWGRISGRNSTSAKDLQKATVIIKKVGWCNSSHSYGGIVPTRTVCAGGIKNKNLTRAEVTDSCLGDSGGPLICNERQCGIVSFGAGCGVAKYPGIYTDVSKFRMWISSQILDKKSGCSKFYNQWTVIVVAILNFVMCFLILT